MKPHFTCLLAMLAAGHFSSASLMAEDASANPAKNGGSEAVGIDNVSVKEIAGKAGAAAQEEAKAAKKKTYIIPFVPPVIDAEDYPNTAKSDVKIETPISRIWDWMQRQLPIFGSLDDRKVSQKDVLDTLRMRTFTYSQISKDDAESQMKEIRTAGYNAILTEGQRYLLVDTSDHPPLSDIQVGSLPYPELVQNTKTVVEAAHKNGLKAFLHLTANSVAEDFAAAHPEWRTLSLKDGTPKKFWGISWACLNNKDFAELVHQRIGNLVKESGADGLMVDETVNMDDGCGCPSCRRLFQEDTGFELPETGAAPWFGDLSSPLYKTFLKWRLNNNLQANLKVRDTLLANNPDGVILSYYALPYYEGSLANHGVTFDIIGEFTDALGWEVGGWYTQKSKKWPLFIANMKLVRAVSESGRAQGNIFVIAGFHDFGELYFTWLLSLSQGAHQYSNPYPSGWSAPTLWEMKYQNFLAGLKSYPEVAVYMSARNNNLIRSASGTINRQNSYFAICNTLSLNQIPYKVIVDKDLQSDSLLAKAKVIVMMNVGLISDADAEALRLFVRNGGTLITSAETSLYDEMGNRRPDFALADLFGCKYLRSFKEQGTLAIHDPHPLLDNFTGELNFQDGYHAVEIADSAEVLAIIKSKDGGEVPGLIFNRYGKGKVIYFAGHPETSLHLFQYNGTNILPRQSSDLPDPRMAEVLCHLVKNSAAGNVSVDNAPAGVVVETYAHKFKGAQGIEVHLLNMTGLASGILSPGQNRITFPDIKDLLPDRGKPIQISVRGTDIQNAFMLSPDFDGLYEVPIERTSDGVTCKIPSFARYLMIYFNQGATDAVHHLAKVEIRSGQPVIKVVESSDLPPGKMVIPRTNKNGEMVSASSQYGDDCHPANVWDVQAVAHPNSNPALWSTDTNEDVNAWWLVDLGMKKDLAQVAVKYRGLSGKYQFVPLSVTVQVSDDGITWTPTASKSSNVPKPDATDSGKFFEYPVGTSARYVRLLFEDGGSSFSGVNGVQILEIKMIGKD